MFATSHEGHQIQHGNPQFQIQPFNAVNSPREFFRVYALRVDGLYVQFVSDRLDPNRCYALVELSEFGPGDESSVAEQVVEAIKHVRHNGHVA